MVESLTGFYRYSCCPTRFEHLSRHTLCAGRTAASLDHQHSKSIRTC
ncbi:DUF2237 family protein [Mycobacterium lepromatosis]